MLNRKTRNKKYKNSRKFVKIWGYIFKELGSFHFTKKNDVHACMPLFQPPNATIYKNDSLTVVVT